MNYRALAIIFLAALLTVCPDRQVATDASQEAAKKKMPAWKVFSSPHGKFKVMMPGATQEISWEEPTTKGKTPITMNFAELPDQGKAFAVSYADYPPGLEYGNETIAHKIIEAVIKGIVRVKKGEAQQQSKIKLGKHHGQEFVLIVPAEENKNLCRIYLVGNRLFQLRSHWSQKRGDTSLDAEKFMKSFQVTE